jgi:hypothetical protein
MNQYKAIFLGTVEPNSDFAQLKRAHNTQKVSKPELPVYTTWAQLADSIPSVYVPEENTMYGFCMSLLKNRRGVFCSQFDLQDLDDVGKDSYHHVSQVNLCADWMCAVADLRLYRVDIFRDVGELELRRLL